MKKFWSKHFRVIGLVFVILICLALITSSAILLGDYSGEMDDQAQTIAILHSDETAAKMKAATAMYQSKILPLTQMLTDPRIQNLEDFNERIRDVRENLVSPVGSDPKYKYVRYFKDGVEYDISGEVVPPESEQRSVLALQNSEEIVCCGVMYDYPYQLALVAYCVPLVDCEYADSVAIWVPLSDVVTLSNQLGEETFSEARYAAAISASGEVWEILYQKDDILEVHGNFYDYLRPKINQKDIVDGVKGYVTAGTSGAYSVKIDAVDYVVCCSSIRAENADPFAVIALYRTRDIQTAGYGIFTTVLGAIIALSLILIIVIVYNIVSRRRAEKKLLTVNDTNERIGCATRVKFERVASDIFSRNKATNFAVCVVDMKHFDYISEHLGSEEVTQMLLHIKLLCTRIMKIDETFGYIGNGRFVVLLHYREMDSLIGRLRTLTALASNYTGKLPAGYKLSLYGGVYQSDKGITDSVGKMIDLAVSAEQAMNLPNDFGSFRCYSDTLHESNVQAEYIEVHMESALRNNEFQVFYQPKYNIPNDRPDGCEALVRWYNPEKDEYMQPGVFLPLFEANRFIVKLDHYVYEQVCIYIRDATEHGQDLYPVSVNVSRITAMERDFLQYYVAIKKKYAIADGFLTIEFTESFAYEDYDQLREIVVSLHQNGFKCSIDDFGTGFSSYNILKELPMDEIKLDRFFLGKGISSERDLKILSSVISLSRDLNMKVTQEGVETQDQLELLRKLGCQVIQGYHYSKPLRLSDYITFLSKKSHSDAFTSRL